MSSRSPESKTRRIWWNGGVEFRKFLETRRRAGRIRGSKGSFVKFAICNELFEGWEFADVCRTVAQIGYRGLEVAPFTLAPLVTQISADRRRDLRRAAEDAGIQIIGLHWLLAKVEGFQLNSPDGEVRRRTAEYLRRQVDLTGDLGGELMVFGSPGARRVPPGASRRDAYEWAADTIRMVVPALAERGVRFCMEPLSPAETDFVQTADEAAELCDMVASPHVVVHLDVKAMTSEGKPIPEIIRAHARRLGHFHANDPNLRGPGMGTMNFVPIFQALREVDYQGWVSVEVFDFEPDPVTIAMQSMEYMVGTSSVEP